MKIEPQIIDRNATWAMPAWAAQAVAALVGLAILLALPAGAMLVTLLAGAIWAGIGIAALRRYGGPGTPALPPRPGGLTTEDWPRELATGSVPACFRSA